MDDCTAGSSTLPSDVTCSFITCWFLTGETVEHAHTHVCSGELFTVKLIYVPVKNNVSF